MSGISRRKLFKRGALLAVPGVLRSGAMAEAAAVPPSGVKIGSRIYESIGVRPIINARGTYTIIGGSLELPEVRAAKEAAAQHFVQLDELMEAVGQRLATLTGAEWGLVTSGCAAGLTHATAACVAGGNPDRHFRLPNLTGFEKDEVIIPSYSRNVYDAAIRAVGVRVVEVDSPEQLEAAFGPRTAMIYVLAGDRSESGPLSLEVICKAANARKVPVLVDAAAEVLTVPNVHLQRGAALVGYSGGKCIRGPQCAGLLLGRKDLVRAAWVHSAPHHGFGRAMKVGKEEAIGMLMAVEMWMKRDHKAEWARWVSWMEQIKKKVEGVEGVTATVRSEMGGLSNRTPRLSVTWDGGKMGFSGQQLARVAFNSDPRIDLQVDGGRGRGGGGGGETGFSVIAYMMQPGDVKVVANRLADLLKAGKGGKLTAIAGFAGGSAAGAGGSAGGAAGRAAGAGVAGSANGVAGSANGVAGSANGVAGSANGVAGSANGVAGSAAGAGAPGSAGAVQPKPASDLGGFWQAEIEYIGSRSRHSLFLRQNGSDLAGTHQGDFVARDLMGSIEGNTVRFQSFLRENGDNVSYTFTGTLKDDRLSGELDLGEYLTARWTATRRQGRRRTQE